MTRVRADAALNSLVPRFCFEEKARVADLFAAPVADTVSNDERFVAADDLPPELRRRPPQPAGDT